MDEADNQGSLCFACFSSKCASDPSQDHKTTPELHSSHSIGELGPPGEHKENSGIGKGVKI